jgi:hypothetical protein
VLWAFLGLSIASNGIWSSPAIAFLILGALAMYAMFRAVDYGGSHDNVDIAVNLVAAVLVTAIFGIPPGFVPMPWTIGVAVLYFAIALGLVGAAFYGAHQRRKEAAAG